MCATKLHGAKIDGPAVAGLSFFAIRWRTKLRPETIIKVRVNVGSIVLIIKVRVAVGSMRPKAAGSCERI